MSGTQTSSVFL